MIAQFDYAYVIGEKKIDFMHCCISSQQGSWSSQIVLECLDLGLRFHEDAEF